MLLSNNEMNITRDITPSITLDITLGTLPFDILEHIGNLTKCSYTFNNLRATCKALSKIKYTNIDNIEYKRRESSRILIKYTKTLLDRGVGTSSLYVKIVTDIYKSELWFYKYYISINKISGSNIYTGPIITCEREAMTYVSDVFFYNKY